MTELVVVTHVETDAVEQAGVGLRIVDNDVVAVHEGVNRRDDALIAEIEEEGILLLLEGGKPAFKFLMVLRMPGEHTAAHRIGKSPFLGRLCVGLADLRMICEPQVVVQGPVEHLDAVEFHVRSELSFKFRIHIVSHALILVLANRAS